MSHKYINFALALILFALILPAQQVYAYKMTISVPPFAPFAFINNPNKAKSVNSACSGVSIQIIKKLLQNTGIKFEQINYPYARILRSLNSGKLDAALIFKNDAVAKSVNYIGPVTTSKVVVLTKPEVTIHNYKQLKSLKKIAVIRNAHYQHHFDQDSSLNKFSVESYNQALKMLNNNRVSAVVGSLEGLDYALRQQKMPLTWLANAFVLGKKSWWLHLSKKSRYKYLIPQLTKTAQKMYQADLNYIIYQNAIKNCKS